MRISDYILIPALLVLILVTLPVTLPIAAAADALSRRRLLADAGGASCVVCGAALGKPALERADEVWAAQMRTMRHGRPSGFLRIARRVYAVCPRCETQYGYDETARAFHLLVDDPGTQPMIQPVS
jgi:hypothetical protein